MMGWENQGRAYESRVKSGSISVMRWALFHMGWHKRRVCCTIHALLTDSTLDHAQRISIDPGKAVVEDFRERSSFNDSRSQTPELSLGKWW